MTCFLNFYLIIISCRGKNDCFFDSREFTSSWQSSSAQMVEERFFSLAKIFLFISFLDYFFLSNILNRRVCLEHNFLARYHSFPSRSLLVRCNRANTYAHSHTKDNPKKKRTLCVRLYAIDRETASRLLSWPISCDFLFRLAIFAHNWIESPIL